MQQVNIRFEDVRQLQQFVNVIEKFEAHFDLGSGQRVVNAKSILGVCTLDFSKPLSLVCSSDDTMFIRNIEPFLYKEERKGGL